MNSGMLFYFFKNRWPRANLAINITTLAVHPGRIGEFKKKIAKREWLNNKSNTQHVLGHRMWFEP